MLLQATYDELNEIISEKAQVKGLTLDYCSSDTAKVSYKFNILGMSPSISAKVRIIAIEGSRIKAEIHAGSIGDIIVSLAKKNFIKKTPEGLIESFDKKIAVVNLDAIPEVQSVFENITVNSVSFTEENVVVDAIVKD